MLDMLNYGVSPEVGALMKSCEELFSRIILVGELTTLDREVLEYYAGELRKHLDMSPACGETRTGVSRNANSTSKAPISSVKL
jgi:hypothetical protein